MPAIRGARLDEVLTEPTGAVTGPMPPGPSLASYVSSGTIPPYFPCAAICDATSLASNSGAK